VSERSDGAAGAPAFSVRDLAVTFTTRRGPVTALSGINLDLHPGRVHVVIGESGSGKSVLAHALLDLLPRNVTLRGRRHLGTEDLTDADARRWREVRARHLAFIPQSPASALNPVRRLGPLLIELARARGVARDAAWPTVAQALAGFDLDPERIRASYPHHLSGGMAQRVVSSLALVGAPEVVIADEPTSGLDAELVDRTARHLTGLAERGAALLVITHDLTLARRLGGTTSVLYASQLLERRPTKALFETPAHPYVTALLDARPERGGRPIPGMPPELTALPGHCVFAARCALVQDRCRAEVPALTAISDGHVRCVRHETSRAEVA
ncbi:MAG: ABC transporter ATP-binding protein, partial [Pseudonocardiaceae bacterium]